MVVFYHCEIVMDRGLWVYLVRFPFSGCVVSNGFAIGI